MAETLSGGLMTMDWASENVSCVRRGQTEEGAGQSGPLGQAIEHFTL